MKRNVATRAAAQSSVAPSIDCAANRRTGPWRMRPLALAVAGALGASGPAWALPTGPQVVSGQLGVVTPAAGRMDLTQGSARAVVNWRGFGIAGGETVRLQQPIGGQALFRVTGNDPSQILGQLSASGHLFLINPRGVLFGGQSRVDVGSLTATTLNLTDGDFLAGRWRFAGDSRAGVDNQGSINAAPGGSIVLLGSQVGNSGSLNAPQGTVALGAGSAATLDVYGNGLVRLNLTGGADAARIEHTGSIGADGGVASLAARGAASTPAAINVDGVVRAQSLVDRNGSIYLSAGPQGEVNLRGTLDASAGAGAASGGRVEIGADRITVAAPARLLADAAGRGDGGTINAIATATMNFAGTLSARGGAAGGDGGNAEVSGHVALTMNGMADLSAPAGRFGTLLLDPGSISIIDSTGNQAGPNVFGDAQVAQLLGAANLTISTANATNNAPETIGVDGAANVTWSAATTLTLNAGRNITVNSGAVISNTAAATGFNAIVMNANRGATPVTGNFSGISIGAATLSTAGGNLVFNGTGGNNGSNAGGSNLGIVLTSAALTTSAGAIRLNGQGGTSAGNIDIGMFIQGSTSIQATGSGSVSVTGTGGGSAGSAANAGIGVPTGASFSLRTASGALSITGTGGPGSSSYGIWQQGALALQSGSGTITLSGSAASTINGLQFDAGSTSITSASGDILLLADRMNFTGVTGTTAGTLALRPLTAGRAITIGAADTTTSLGLSATELAGLRPSGRLEIGSATAGPLTVASALAPAAGTGTLALISGGTIDVNAPITGGGARLNLNGTAGVRLGAALSSNAANVASTRAIAIRSSGIFDNQVGAGALSTPAGTWTVSLATPAGQNFNGLLSGNNAVWNNAVSSNVNPTGNRYSFAIAPSIVVDAANASKTYGDVLPAAVALNGAPTTSLASSVGGAFNDYATSSVSGTYLRASPGLPATAGVGSYALTISDFTNLSSTLPGYAFVLGRPGTLSVTQRPLTLTPSATSRIYGDPNPATSGASGDPGGLVNGDSVTRVDLRTAAGTTSNVGTYLTSGSNAVFGRGLASNYFITYADNPAGLRVDPRPLTVMPNAQSRLYGEANPASGGFTLTAGSLVNGDTIGAAILDSPANVGSNVGSYDLSATGALFTRGLATNYSVSTATLANGLSVTPRPLTLTPSATSRIYGEANPASGGFTLTAGSLVNGDTIGAAILDSPANVGSNVGSYDLSATGALFTRGLATNYSVSTATLANGLSVTPRPLTLTPSATSRIYGEANPASGGFTLTAGSLVNGDTIGAAILDSPANVASNVGSYDLSATGALFTRGLATNYSVSTATLANGLSVTPRPLTLTPSATSRIYGEANPASGGFTLTAGSLVNGDSIGAAILDSPANVGSNVGSYDLSATGALFTRGLATNYSVSTATLANGLSVTPRPLTLTPSATSRIYGEANPASGGFTLTAGSLVNGDSIGAAILDSPANVASNVGSYDLSATGALFTRGLATNYSVSTATLANGLSVTPRPLTLTPSATSRIYGEANPASGGFTLTAGSLVNGDSIGAAILDSPANVGSNVGSYDLSATGALFTRGLATNYSVSTATLANGLSVTPRPLTLTPSATSRIYGEANPASGGFTLTAGSLVNGDTIGAAILDSPANVASNVGSYDLSATGALFTRGLATNYSVSTATLANGLSVTPRPLTLTPSATSRIYGEANPASGGFTLTAGSLVNGDTIGAAILDSPANVGSNVGSYDLSATGALFTRGLATNYSVSTATLANGLSVTPRPLTLTPSATSRIYGDPNPATSGASGDPGGLVNGDTVTRVDLRTAAGTTSNVGTYLTSGSNAVFGRGLASNYFITYADNPAGLRVDPRPLTVMPNAQSRVYGGANPLAGTALLTGGTLVGGDTLGRISLGSPATPASDVGTYPTTGSNAVFATGLATNYAISYAANPSGLQITQRPLTLTPDPQNRLYGESNPARGSATGNAGGLVNGDAVASVALTSPATAASAVGAYDLGASDARFSRGRASNYAITYVNAIDALSLRPRPLVITVLSDQGKVAGSPDPALGFVISDGSLVGGDALAGSLARAPGEAPGLYPIVLGSLNGGANYALRLIGGDFVISPAATNLTIDRAPTTGEPNPSASSLLALLNVLPPTAAGPEDERAAECVREQILDRERLGSSRLISRGIRLPEGVIDTCRRN